MVSADSGMLGGRSDAWVFLESKRFRNGLSAGQLDAMARSEEARMYRVARQSQSQVLTQRK